MEHLQHVPQLGGFPSTCPANCLVWARVYLGDCVCSERDRVSLALGLLSLVSWAWAEIPQIATNLVTGSAEGISTSFVLLWAVGDVFNLTGCLLNPYTLPTQFYIAVLYLLTTLILVSQSFYYRWTNRQPVLRIIDDDHTNFPDASQPLLRDEDIWKTHALPPMPGDSPTAFLEPSSAAVNHFPFKTHFELPSTPVTRHIDASDDTFIISARSLVASPTPVTGSFLPRFAFGKATASASAQQHVRMETQREEGVVDQDVDTMAAPTYLLSPKSIGNKAKLANVGVTKKQQLGGDATTQVLPGGVKSIPEVVNEATGPEGQKKMMMNMKMKMKGVEGETNVVGLQQQQQEEEEQVASAHNEDAIVVDHAGVGSKSDVNVNVNVDVDAIANANADVLKGGGGGDSRVEQGSGQATKSPTVINVAVASTVLMSGIGLFHRLVFEGQPVTNSTHRSLLLHLPQLGRQVATAAAAGASSRYYATHARFGGAVFPIILGLGAKKGNVGEVLGWFMCAIYMGSRLPQIYLNMHRGRVEGLNPLMFILALVGNLTYVASILVRSMEWSHIGPNLPWILDAGICAFLDMLILVQFVYFSVKDGPESELDEENAADFARLEQPVR